MPDMIRFDVNIINIRFEYSDTDTVSNVEYLNSDTDISEPLSIDLISNTVRNRTVFNTAAAASYPCCPRLQAREQQRAIADHTRYARSG
jgi:hypothetical protein